MENIIQFVFLLIPGFKIEYFALLPALALLLVGIFVETDYTSRLTFFLNSVTLVSYFGVKQIVSGWIGALSILFFVLATWSFLSYISHDSIKKIEWFERLVQHNQWILRIGGSLIVGLVLVLDSIK